MVKDRAWRQDYLRRRRKEQISAGNYRLRTRLLRLRRGWLAGCLPGEWLAPGGLSAGQGASLPSLQEQSRRHFHRCHQGLRPRARTGWGQACCVGDYNNDGYDDLFVTYYGQNALYRNNGNGTFTDVTKEAGLMQPGPKTRWNTGCTFVDYDQRRPSGPVRRQLRRFRSEDRAAAGSRPLHLQGYAGRLRTARTARAARTSFITTTATARSPTSARRPASGTPSAPMA